MTVNPAASGNPVAFLAIPLLFRQSRCLFGNSVAFPANQSSFRQTSLFLLNPIAVSELSAENRGVQTAAPPAPHCGYNFLAVRCGCRAKACRRGFSLPNRGSPQNLKSLTRSICLLVIRQLIEWTSTTDEQSIDWSIDSRSVDCLIDWLIDQLIFENGHITEGSVGFRGIYMYYSV